MKRSISLFISALVFLAISPNVYTQIEDEVHCPGVRTYYEIPNAIAGEKRKAGSAVKLDIAMQTPKLKEVPVEVCELTNLRCIDLSFNHVRVLPEAFKKLVNLEYINMAGTRYWNQAADLEQVANILKTLPKLQKVDARDHPEWTQTQADLLKELFADRPEVKVLVDKKFEK